jgi:hypothetical protein
MDDATQKDTGPDDSRRTFLRRMAITGVAVGVPAVSSFALGGCFDLGHGGSGNTYSN